MTGHVDTPRAPAEAPDDGRPDRGACRDCGGQHTTVAEALACDDDVLFADDQEDAPA